MRSARGFFRGVLALAAMGVVACGADPIQFVPKGFDHPADVAFVCFDVEAGEARPLSECEAAAGVEGTPLALHAVATQRTRGELAVVNVKSRRLVDAHSLVPGFTFVPVGELPNAVVIPEDAPTYTYVANYGSQEILALRTADLRQDLAVAQPTVTSLALEAPPVDMVGAPDGRTLYVALSGVGKVQAIAVGEDGSFGAITDVQLSAAAPAPVPPPDAPVDAYCASCPVADCGGLAAPGAPVVRTPVSLGARPEPVSLTFDALGSRLLVADAALPMIHVVDISSGAVEVAPLATAVPVRAVAITSPLPDTVAENTALASATTRYVYAIDAVDGSVLVLDDASGAVLSPETAPGRLRDRIHLPAAAATLAVIEPRLADGEVCTSATPSLAENAGPADLRGAFLAVGTTEGLVRVVDIYDMDVSCRECSEGSSTEAAHYVARHRPRVGARIRQLPSMSGLPAFVVNALSFRPDAAGATDAVVAPDLAPIECASDMVQIFPSLTESAVPVVCASRSPWLATNERWQATFEGAIPGTIGGLGAFVEVGGERALVGEVPFCRRGVLGAENVAALDDAEPEAGYGGDVVFVTSVLDGAAREDDACVSRFGAGASDARRFLPVRRSHGGRLVLDVSGGAFADLVRCFPDNVAYRVFAADSFVVAGAITGTLHRVVDGVTTEDACVVDPDGSRRAVTRARYGRPFDNGRVAFRIERPVPAAEGDAVLARGDLGYLEFITTGAPFLLAVDTGLLPAGIAYSYVDNRVYILDQAGRGFVRYPASDFTPSGIQAPFR